MLSQLIDLFHRIYDVQGIVRWGGLFALVAIVFSETGLLVGFFLPGDSLLVTAGIYCTSANPEPSHVLRAIGQTEDLTLASLRFGLGRFNTEEEIDFAARAVIENVRRLRELSSLA